MRQCQLWKTTFWIVLLTCIIPLNAQQLSPQHLTDHGLPTGPATQMLPASGALLHVQIHDLIGVIEGIEEILVAGIPEKAAPPEVQDLLKQEHPLLTALGMQSIQQPLSVEALEQITGINTRGTVGLTLYLGDPRHKFVLSLPTSTRDPLTPLLNGLLEPTNVEEISIGGKRATRFKSKKLHFLPEVYLVSSTDTLYLCGDRSLVQALYHTPKGRRFGQDPFMKNILTEANSKQIRLIANIATAKPFILQLQHIAAFAKNMIPIQRQELLKQVPKEAKDQIEMQMRMQMGVRDIDELADYLECITVATLEQIVDCISGRLLAFEGLTLAANLKGQMAEVSLGLHSSDVQSDTSTQALPMDQIKEALAWLGPDIQSFRASGQKPQSPQSPILTAWLKAIQKQCQQKNLDWPGLARLIKLQESLQPIPRIESQSPWVLYTHAPLYPVPSIEEANSLEDYFFDLELPICREISIIPDQGDPFLANCFQAETQVRNQNRELEFEFANTIQRQKPWCLQENRFDVTTLENGIKRYTRESVWTSRSGLFGYDQHELINRKIVHARRVGNYTVYHRGVKNSPWLANLSPEPSSGLNPGIETLLQRVPEGPTSISIQRILQNLPQGIKWISALESRLHNDAYNYIKEAQAAVDNHDLKKAKHLIRGMKMPFIVGSVSINPQTNKVYALLPSGEMPLLLPRPKVLPLVEAIFADYANQSHKLGGSLVYSQNQGESRQYVMMQNTAAITALTRTVGNSIFENYLASSKKQKQLQRKLMTQRDGDINAFDEVIARNPQWAFIPQPQPKVPAKPSKKIPARKKDTCASKIDLSKYYNAALNETWHKSGMMNNSLKDFPRGLQTMDETTFDIRGIVQLSGQRALRELSVKFPQKVTNIAIEQKAQKLHFLHNCGWWSPKGTTIGHYIIHYRDGQEHKIPIVYGKDVRDWWMGKNDDQGSTVNVVWRGKNHAAPNNPKIGIAKTTWENPNPAKKISHIDFVSTMANSAPFLIAITVE